MRPKQTLRANTYALPGGGILHVDKILVPILTEDQCPNCGKVMNHDSDHDDDGNETQQWLECANCENRIRLSAKPANAAGEPQPPANQKR